MTEKHGPEWTWGDRMRKIRRTVGVSQDELARMLGVNAGTLGAWEGGRAKPSRHLAEAVAGKIAAQWPDKVSAHWMLGRRPEAAGSVSYLYLVGEEEISLPRMDSNHQPPDSRFITGHRLVELKLRNLLTRPLVEVYR